MRSATTLDRFARTCTDLSSSLDGWIVRNGPAIQTAFRGIAKTAPHVHRFLHDLDEWVPSTELLPDHLRTFIEWQIPLCDREGRVAARNYIIRNSVEAVRQSGEPFDTNLHVIR